MFAPDNVIMASVSEGFIVIEFMKIKVAVILMLVTAAASSPGIAADWQFASGDVEFQTLANIYDVPGKDSFRESDTPSYAPAPEGLAQGDSDRGCCIYRTPATMCIYTNRGYCRTKAEQMSIRYDFYVNINCRDIADCR